MNQDNKYLPVDMQKVKLCCCIRFFRRTKSIQLLILFYVALMSPPLAYAETYSLSGSIVDEDMRPLEYATIALLLPEDSTLAYYSISNSQGAFTVKNIKPGTYLFQTVFLGYNTFYKELNFPGQANELGVISLKPKIVELNSTEISAERIPLLIKKDTIEYDAAAFKTKPDAVVEDLLKKLPGVEVDRAGNVKAQGEDVKNVLVDGKEFFGSDPKVATKNLPADAIDKVQVYDKKSEESELTGVDDGIRSKTVNLLLKENKKSAWLGELNAGAGTDEHYQLSAKIYRFTKTKQFAALGMLNNINQFGFTFQDYLDFSGGFRGLMSGSGDVEFKINDDSNFPVNFGQPVNGLISSGAGGLNYSYEKSMENRLSMSYMGNGSRKKLNSNTNSTNYTASGNFLTKDGFNETSERYNHRFNLNARKKLSSNVNLLINANGSVGESNFNSFFSSSSRYGDTLVNSLTSNKYEDGTGYNLSASANFISKWGGKWRLLKFGSSVDAYDMDDYSQWINFSNYYSPELIISEVRYLGEREKGLDYSFNSSLTRALSEKAYLVADLQFGMSSVNLSKKLGIPVLERTPIDSLSADLKSEYDWLKPALTYKRNTVKSQFSLSALLETGTRKSTMKELSRLDETILYFLPRINWQKEYRRGRNFSMSYSTKLHNPEATQLYPLSYSSNSLQRMYGNRDLKSEYIHDLGIHSMIFDQFSFTSFFAGLNFRYTKNKINWSRMIDDRLNQLMTLVNVKEDFDLSTNVEFGTAIRMLKINVSVDWQERWNRGINLVNSVENLNTNFTHSLSLKFDNRKKNKWDVSVGAGIDYTQSRYSIGSDLNNNYISLSYFSEINFNPDDKWNLNFSADITQYQAESFQKSRSVPILKASLTRYLLKNGRLAIGLEVFDILDKNTGISRSAELNYLQEKETNTIGRYLMLNLKFRLNKFSKKGMGKVDMDIK